MTGRPRDRWLAMARRTGRAVFGDRTGYALFLGALLFFSFTWRIGFLINDNYTVANALLAVENGHLFFTEIQYGPQSGASPGTIVVGERLYGRNYGQVVLALPFLLAVRAVALVADLRIALLGGVGLLLMAFVRQVGRLYGRRRAAALVGAVAGLLLFVLNVWLAYDVVARWHLLIALQLQTMFVAGLVGVVLYRLGAELYGRRAGVFAGAVVVLASPVAFWATVPKRHSLVALLVVATLYSLVRSRTAASPSAGRRHNALAYVWVGLCAWVHAALGLVLLVALVAGDFSSDRRLDPRRLAAIGLAFGLSLVPFALTNVLIGGSPLEPPRLLPAYEGEQPVDLSEPGSGGPSADGGPEGGSGASPLDALGGLVSGVQGRLWRLSTAVLSGFGALLDLDRLSSVFLLGTFVEAPNTAVQRGRLALLQAFPLAGLVVALPLVKLREHAPRLDGYVGDRRPLFAADVFVATFVALLVVLALPRLPIHASVTVRYLHAVYPLLGYLLLRSAALRTVLQSNWRTIWSVHAATVLVGGQLFVAYVAVTGLGSPGAIAATGEVAIAAAALLALWGVVATTTSPGPRSRRRMEQAGAALVGAAAGWTTVFVLLAALLYFPVNRQFALPVVRVVSRALVGLG